MTIRVSTRLTVGAALVGLLASGAATAIAQAPAPPVPPGSALNLGMIFTAFFVMLGPLKLVGPFAALTSDMEQGAARRLALQALAFACAGASRRAFSDRIS